MLKAYKVIKSIELSFHNKEKVDYGIHLENGDSFFIESGFWNSNYSSKSEEVFILRRVIYSEQNLYKDESGEIKTKEHTKDVDNINIINPTIKSYDGINTRTIGMFFDKNTFIKKIEILIEEKIIEESVSWNRELKLKQIINEI